MLDISKSCIIPSSSSRVNLHVPILVTLLFPDNPCIVMLQLFIGPIKSFFLFAMLKEQQLSMAIVFCLCTSCPFHCLFMPELGCIIWCSCCINLLFCL